MFWSETGQLSRELTIAVGLVGAAVGPNNRIVVDCGVILDASERRVLWQRFAAGKGLVGGGEAAAGRNAGSLILQRILKH